MDPKWAKFVMDYITIGGNRAQVITLKGLPCGDLGIINIYVPFGQFYWYKHFVGVVVGKNSKGLQLDYLWGLQHGWNQGR